MGMRDKEGPNGSGSLPPPMGSCNEQQLQQEELEEQKDKLTSLPVDTANEEGEGADKKMGKPQVANNGPPMDHHNQNNQHKQHGCCPTNSMQQEPNTQESCREQRMMHRPNKPAPPDKEGLREEEDDLHVDMSIDEEDGSIYGVSENRLTPDPVAAVSAGRQYSKQFNRLDPNRRSFSSPSVNTLPLAVATAGTVTQPTGPATNNCATTNQSAAAKVVRLYGGSVQVRTESAREEKRHSKTKTGSTEKLRRRTALGLIGSFGSAHFRLSSSSSRVAPETAGAIGSSNNNCVPINAKQQGGSNSWRNWFLGRAPLGGEASSTNPIESSSSNNRSQPTRTSNTTRKFLLRNLRPSQAASNHDQASSLSEACGLRSSAVADHQRKQHPAVTGHVDEKGGPPPPGERLNAAATCEPLDHDCLERVTQSSVGSPIELKKSSRNTTTNHPHQEPATETDQHPPHQPPQPSHTNSNKPSAASVGPPESLANCRQSHLNSSNSQGPPTELDSSASTERPVSVECNNNDNKNINKDNSPISHKHHQDTTPVRLSSSQDQEDRAHWLEKNMPSALHQQQLAATNELAASLVAAPVSAERQSLVDRLIDSQLEWRQLIREANGAQWSLSQLGELQIKRQEVIHELVQTERHHCLTLALMRQVYLNGLRQLNESRSLRDSMHNLTTNNSTTGHNHHHLQQQQQQQQQVVATKQPYKATTSPPNDCAQTSINPTNHSSNTNTSDLIDLERLFPALEDLIQAHELFFAHLRLRLVESCHQAASPGHLVGLVGPLGDLLCDQFRLHQQQQSSEGLGGQQQKQSVAQAKPVAANGHKLLQAYAKFCGQHYDSSRYYKHLMQNDKGFKQFIEHCNKQNASCRQRGIPECNLLVTQRLTKYPLLIEQLIKTSKDDPEEEQKLREALRECKALLAELNNQLARKESFERLLDIYAHFSPKSYTIYNRHIKFTKHDLLQHKRLRQLLHSDAQIRIWSATRRKLFQVLCLILNDIVVFLRIESSSTSASSSSQAAAAAASSANPASVSAAPVTHQLYQHHLSAAAATNESEAPGEQQQQHSLGTHLALHSPHGSLMLASSPNLTSIQQPLAVVAAAGNCQTSASGSGNSFSIKYYFANIDNKSSVISLSKLLIREKAATDQEPRVYLISSSPRQPEMYELAFVSKRHQTSFVDKLKSCVEQHNKNLEGHHGDPLDDDFLDDDDEDEHDEEENPLQRNHLHTRSSRREHDLSTGCLCDEQEVDHHIHRPHLYRDDDDDDDLERDAAMDDDDDESHEDDDDEELEADADDEMCQRFETPRCSRGRYCSGLCRPEMANGRTTNSKRRASGGLELNEFELDIEQDVVPEPPASSSSSSEEPASFIYATPEGGCGAPPQDGQCISGTTAGAQLSDGGPRASSSEPEASNESGLSERAKDSLDEAAPSKQKLRANRRRRAQRPRNVSNQSSSSSEAAHRQAIQLISSGAGNGSVENSSANNVATASKYEEEFDSGRGHDDSSSAASTSSNSLGSRSISTSSSCIQQQHQQNQPENTIKEPVESSKCSDNGSMKEKKIPPKSCAAAQMIRAPTPGRASEKSPAVGTNGNGNSATCSPSSSSSSTSSCASSTASGSTVAGDKGSGGSNLIKCSSSLLSKSSCSFMKQRKLSTVSTMSSQLKLLSKLKSGLAESHLCLQCNHRGGSRCTNHQQQAFGASGSCCCCVSQHSTLNKQIRQQMRRSTFIPEQKLEELRDLRIQLDKDKQEWQAKFDKMQEQLLNERRELDLAREKLKQDRQQVANEREQLYRKLDVLKEKGILLSPSHKVIITTPELRIYPPNGATTTTNENFMKQNYGPHHQPQHYYYNNQANYVGCNGILHHHPRQPPLHQVVNQDNHSSTIQIVNQSQSRYLSNPTASSLAMNNANNNHCADLHLSGPRAPPSSATGQRHSSNMFIQNGKVPLHLSEGGSAGTQKSSPSSSSLSLLSKVSLIGSSSSGLLAERLCGSSPNSKLSGPSNGMESHLI